MIGLTLAEAKRMLAAVAVITESTVAMAAASPNECSAADAPVSEGRLFDAEGVNLHRERDARPGARHRRALGPSSV
jgi:hypothetical protein